MLSFVSTTFDEVILCYSPFFQGGLGVSVRLVSFFCRYLPLKRHISSAMDWFCVGRLRNSGSFTVCAYNA